MSNNTDQEHMTEESAETQNNKRKHKIEHSTVVSIYLAIYDAIVVSLSYFLALLLRFDFQFSRIPEMYYEPWLKFSPIYIVVCLAVFYFFRLYNSIWRFASYTELSRIIKATVITCGFHVIATLLFFQRMPISYYVMGGMFQFVFTSSIRFAYRFVLLLRASREKVDKNIMIVGVHSIIGTT